MARIPLTLWRCMILIQIPGKVTFSERHATITYLVKLTVIYAFMRY